jgi:hypothetical protein
MVMRLFSNAACKLPEADFAPLLQVPPACGGNQTAVPLAKQGEPHGGGLQKVSRNQLPNRKEGAGSGEIQKRQLHDACQQFEAVFLLQLWRAMQRTVPRERQTLNYAEMFDLTFAEYLARYGQFGIAEKLYEQLTRGCQTP